VASKIALLARRRAAVVLALTALAAFAGACHGHGGGDNGHGGGPVVGLWDGPL
jgi:hypothetical protein